MDGQAEAGGERGEDTDLQGPGRGVRLPGIYVRANVFPTNKGAPGVDGQDFADIEAYGVERWLGELALALRQETYRPEPIRRVFIPNLMLSI
jgi:hypothetical protein